MKFFLISDNIDPLTGLRVVAIAGKLVHTRLDCLPLLENQMSVPEIAIILVTTKLIELCPDIISEIKLKQPKPLITEIPDRHGHSKIGEAIDGYVSEAIGVKL